MYYILEALWAGPRRDGSRQQGMLGNGVFDFVPPKILCIALASDNQGNQL